MCNIITRVWYLVGGVHKVKEEILIKWAGSWYTLLCNASCAQNGSSIPDGAANHWAARSTHETDFRRQSSLFNHYFITNGISVSIIIKYLH